MPQAEWPAGREEIKERGRCAEPLAPEECSQSLKPNAQGGSGNILTAAAPLLVDVDKISSEAVVS